MYFPTEGLSPREQHQLLLQVSPLMARQVKGYQKARHLGESTSVPSDLARELMDSVAYTIDISGGIRPGMTLEQALRQGQQLLESRIRRAKELLKLVVDTAPSWQTKCRWEALEELGRYLKTYDHLHLAHRGPDGLFYPVPVSAPPSLQGIDLCLWYLTVLWQENQIMLGARWNLEALWDRLPKDCLNQCEHLLTNGFGKLLLEEDPKSLVFSTEDHCRLHALLQSKAPSERIILLDEAAQRFFRQIRLSDPAARTYGSALLPSLGAKLCCDLSGDLLFQTFL